MKAWKKSSANISWTARHCFKTHGCLLISWKQLTVNKGWSQCNKHVLRRSRVCGTGLKSLLLLFQKQFPSKLISLSCGKSPSLIYRYLFTPMAVDNKYLPNELSLAPWEHCHGRWLCTLTSHNPIDQPALLIILEKYLRRWMQQKTSLHYYDNTLDTLWFCSDSTETSW